MQEVLDSDLTQRPAVLTEVNRGFPESIQANRRVVFSVEAHCSSVTCLSLYALSVI